MTTPRDDIAGLSERLRAPRMGDPVELACQLDGLAIEAATQLDVLSAERTHFARFVQELQRALMYWMPGVSEATENETNGRCGDDAQLLAGYEGEFPSECWGDKVLARALRAEQERDEAYERARKTARNAILNLSQEQRKIGDICDHAITTAIRRLASGPEKEKKE